MQGRLRQPGVGSQAPRFHRFGSGIGAATLSPLRADMRENASVIGRLELPWVSPPAGRDDVEFDTWRRLIILAITNSDGSQPDRVGRPMKLGPGLAGVLLGEQSSTHGAIMAPM